MCDDSVAAFGERRREYVEGISDGMGLARLKSAAILIALAIRNGLGWGNGRDAFSCGVEDLKVVAVGEIVGVECEWFLAVVYDSGRDLCRVCGFKDVLLGIKLDGQAGRVIGGEMWGVVVCASMHCQGKDCDLGC